MIVNLHGNLPTFRLRVGDVFYFKKVRYRDLYLIYEVSEIAHGYTRTQTIKTLTDKGRTWTNHYLYSIEEIVIVARL